MYKKSPKIIFTSKVVLSRNQLYLINHKSKAFFIYLTVMDDLLSDVSFPGSFVGTVLVIHI